MRAFIINVAAGTIAVVLTFLSLLALAEIGWGAAGLLAAAALLSCVVVEVACLFAASAWRRLRRLGGKG